MGCVSLPFIMGVVKSKQEKNERPAFMIAVTMYVDKDKKEHTKRDIYFSCDTVEQRDTWMIAIEYLKGSEWLVLDRLHSQQVVPLCRSK